MLGLNPYWEAVLTVAGMNIIATLGMYITTLSGQLSAGHAAFVGMAAYTTGVLSVKLGVPLPLAWASGAIAAFVFGGLLGYILLPLARWFLAVALFAINIAFVSVIESSEYLGSAQGFKGFQVVTDFTLVWGFVLAISMFLLLFTNSPWELAIRSVGDDPTAAEAIGISAKWVRVLSLAMGAIISSFAGILLAHWLTIVQPADFGFGRSLDYLLYVMIGGRDTFLGAWAGGLFLTLLSEFLRLGHELRLVLFGALLTLVVLFLPGGLVGRWSTGVTFSRALRMILRLPQKR